MSAMNMMVNSILAEVAPQQSSGVPNTASSRTEMLRAALRDSAPYGCRAEMLARRAGIRSKLVGALLRQDIRLGRVRVTRDGSSVTYHHVATPPLAPYLALAVRKLEALGYRVMSP